jgi:hypothetical protein
MIMLSITTSAMGYLRGATNFRRNTRLDLSNNTLQVKEDVSTKTLNDTFLGVSDNTLQVKEDASTLKLNDTVLGLSDDTLQVKEEVSTLTLNDTFENEIRRARRTPKMTDGRIDNSRTNLLACSHATDDVPLCQYGAVCRREGMGAALGIRELSFQ